MLKATDAQHEELALKVARDYISTNTLDDIESFISDNHLDTLKDHLQRLILGFKNTSPDFEHLVSFNDEYAGLTYDATLIEKQALAKMQSQLERSK